MLLIGFAGALAIGLVGWLILRERHKRTQLTVTGIVFAMACAGHFHQPIVGLTFMAMGGTGRAAAEQAELFGYGLAVASVGAMAALCWFVIQKRWVLALSVVGFAFAYAILVMTLTQAAYSAYQPQ